MWFRIPWTGATLQLVRCDDHRFNQALCPLDQISHITRVYSGIREDTTHCTPIPNRCTEDIDTTKHSDVYDNVIIKCNASSACEEGLVPYRVSLPQCDGRTTNYMIIQYTCSALKSGELDMGCMCLGHNYQILSILTTNIPWHTGIYPWHPASCKSFASHSIHRNHNLQLNISVIHLNVTSKHLNISAIHLNVTSKHPNISPYISKHDLNISPIYFMISSILNICAIYSNIYINTSFKHIFKRFEDMSKTFLFEYIFKWFTDIIYFKICLNGLVICSILNISNSIKDMFNSFEDMFKIIWKYLYYDTPFYHLLYLSDLKICLNLLVIRFFSVSYIKFN